MEKSNSSGNRLMLVLLFLVSLVAVVAIIVAAVSLTNSDNDTPSINVNSQPGSSGSGGSGSPIIINSGSGGAGSNTGDGDRIFKIMLSLASTPNSYLNEQGYMKGFETDLVNAVCGIGGMNCVTVWDDSSNCWTKDGHGGQGLFNGWYDACFNTRPTIERVQVFDFSLPFFKPESYHLFTLKTNSDFDGSDITGKKIGFVDGWSASMGCLARHTEIKGSAAATENSFHYENTQACFDALESGEVDALFGSLKYYTAFMDKVKELPSPPIACALDGNAVMTTKDNDFNTYWNRAFQKLKDSGKFRKLCEQAKLDHGHIGDLRVCVDAP